MSAVAAKGLRVAAFLCANLGASLLLLAALELGARAWSARGEGARAAAVVPHAILAQQEWGERYLADVAEYGWRLEYAPFVGFQAAPFRSETINVDEAGRRLHGPPAPPEGAPALFVFGGSTMFGVGAPDPGTIAAHLARALPEFAIENHSASWWTSSQCVADLLRSLRGGRHPALALFYDGINDVDVVTYGGHPGGIAPQAEHLLGRALRPPEEREESLLDAVAGRLALVALLRESGAARRLLGAGARRRAGVDDAARARQLEATRLAGPALERAAARVAQVYEANVRALTALGREHGIESHFFLQPFPLISEKRLTRLEQQVVALRRRGWEPDFARRVYRRIAASAYLRAHPGFHDLQHVFDEERGPLFVDEEHLLPAGNAIVARAMLERIGRAAP